VNHFPDRDAYLRLAAGRAGATDVPAYAYRHLYDPTYQILEQRV
jgi:hypothetical protein